MYFKTLYLFLIIVAMSECAMFKFLNNKNLTKVTWMHAVNNKGLLETALENNTMMLEADVQIGKLTNDPSKIDIPIMAHPPNTESDLSLEQFLMNVTEFNTKNPNKQKGVKLDFKTIEAFQGSVTILKNMTETVNYPLWLNADILEGPGNPTTIPVNATQFLKTAKQFKNAVLSLGWTTNAATNQSYTDNQISEMLETIKNKEITQPITYAVRAIFVAESLKQMEELVKNKSDSTLTIWSAVGDSPNATKLSEVILKIGVDKVYIDVPENLMDQLNLSSFSNKVTALNILTVCMSAFLLITNMF